MTDGRNDWLAPGSGSSNTAIAVAGWFTSQPSLLDALIRVGETGSTNALLAAAAIGALVAFDITIVTLVAARR